VKIATWNVNSLKVRLPHVLDWLGGVRPDVLALQETKTPDESFPGLEIESAGYHAVFAGQKTYNGVAILSREPASGVLTEVPGLEDPQRRVIAATVGGVRVIDLYVVNGQDVGTEKYAWKLHWLERVSRFIEAQLREHPRLAVVGDFNIAPEDRDVYDPELWHERILCSTPEREALQRILGLGLRDTFRLFDQPEKSFTWWDYRQGAFRRNLGLRIDLVLASEALAAACTACTVDTGPRRLERPSDHAPVLAEFGT